MDPRVQVSFALGIAFAVTLTAAVVLSSVHAGPDVALGVMAGIVALSGWVFTWGGALATAGLAWLMLDGFVSDRNGVLRWHGGRDVVYLLVPYGCAAAVVTVRSVQLKRRHRLEFDQLLQAWPEPPNAAQRTRGERHA